MHRSLRPSVLALLLALTACAGARDGTSVGVPLPPPDLPDDLASFLLTAYPTPREAQYGDTFVDLGTAEWIDETSDDFLEILDELGLSSTWRDLDPEGYVLRVAVDDGDASVMVAAADEQGRRWAELTLSQIARKDAAGRQLARQCLIVDAPAFPLRGNKRPRAWERRYRANFAWGTGSDAASGSGRTVVPFAAPGSPLDASSDGVARTLAAFRPWQEKGVRKFAVKFDDVGFGLTPQSRLAFGSYARAMVAYVASVRRGLRAEDPTAQLYFLPQTYWWDDRRLPPYAMALRRAGGLPRDVGLVVTGPDIISREVDTAGLRNARDLFGLDSTKALIYDNLGREGDWGPLTGREAALVEEADGVFGERGTPVNRLTRLDWLWNPYAYDAERSWRRALFELAGPRGYAALRDACDAFRRDAPRDEAARLVAVFAETDLGDWVLPVPHQDLSGMLRADLARLSAGEPDSGVSVVR